MVLKRRLYYITIFMLLSVFTLVALGTSIWAVNQTSVTTNITFLYTASNVLTVYQPYNSLDKQWTKADANETLQATPVQIESNSLLDLKATLSSGINFDSYVDDYYTAPVYRNIDLVNVDINTGEIIGKFSNPDYDFEWYGGEVTLPAGTTLASGRQLGAEESFTLDVYTYYPTMYIARYLNQVDGELRTYISLSENPFSVELYTGNIISAVKVDEYYTATFPATIYNQDGTVALVNDKVVTRSYQYDYTPTTDGATDFMLTYYDYAKTQLGQGTALSSYIQTELDKSTTMENYLTWATNLTQAWENSSLNSAYRKVKGVQGENYTAFIYPLLYLVKYANNDSQTMVGKGNVESYNLYNSSSIRTKLKGTNGTALSSSSDNSYYYSQKGPGTIGVVNVEQAGDGTSEYIVNGEGETVLSESSYDAGGMNFGFNSDYNSGEGLYTHHFLTQVADGKRVLRDGYAGSDGYTSVFCLGSAEPWGTIGTWVYGFVGTNNDNNNAIGFITTQDYDYTTNNWVVSQDSQINTFDAISSLLTTNGYQQLGYNLFQFSSLPLAKSTAVDTTNYNNLLSLIGFASPENELTQDEIMAEIQRMIDSGEITQEELEEISSSDPYFLYFGLAGLGDQHGVLTDNGTISGCLRGGSTRNSTTAGAFCFTVANHLTDTHAFLGFRPSLISVRG